MNEKAAAQLEQIRQVTVREMDALPLLKKGTMIRILLKNYGGEQDEVCGGISSLDLFDKIKVEFSGGKSQIIQFIGSSRAIRAMFIQGADGKPKLVYNNRVLKLFEGELDSTEELDGDRLRKLRIRCFGKDHADIANLAAAVRREIADLPSSQRKY